MREIVPLNIWSNGITKIATCIRLYISYDDLTASAVLQYSLCTDTADSIYQGQISIDGQEYLDWGASSDSNQEAYVLAASALNLTLI